MNGFNNYLSKWAYALLSKPVCQLQRLLWSLCLFVLTAGAVQAATGVSTVYLHEDAMGSTVAVTDAAGDLVWQSTYDPYGEPEDDGAQVLSYTGHVYDEDSGLIYMGARYYDPDIGRFLAPDPVGFRASEPLSFNPYVYANNNPYRYVDPNGESPLEILTEILPAFANSIAPLTAFAVGTVTGDQALVNVAVGELSAMQVNNSIALASLIAPPGSAKAARLARGLCSFSPETLVGTPDGDREIASLKTGDTVWAKSERTGEISARTLTDAYSHWHDDLRLIEITDSAGGIEQIHTTDEHPFYVEGKGWVRADHLAAGDALLSLQGAALQVASNRTEAGEGLMYNLTVAEDHTFAVSGDWVWVHNDCGDSVSVTSREALRKAKVQNKIPRSAQPDRTWKPGTDAGRAEGLDSRNVKLYEYTNSSGEKIRIRHDRPAHYSDGGSQGSHFNAGKASDTKLKQHHNYGGQ